MDGSSETPVSPGGSVPFKLVEVEENGDCTLASFKMGGRASPRRKQRSPRAPRAKRHGWTNKKKRDYTMKVIRTRFEAYSLLTVGADPKATNPDELLNTVRALLHRRGVLQRALREGRLHLAAYDQFHYLGPMENHVGDGLPLLHWHVMTNAHRIDQEVLEEARQIAADSLGAGATLRWRETASEAGRERLRRYTCKGRTKTNPPPHIGVPAQVVVSSNRIPLAPTAKKVRMPFADWKRLCDAQGKPPLRMIHFGCNLLGGQPE